MNARLPPEPREVQSLQALRTVLGGVFGGIVLGIFLFSMFSGSATPTMFAVAGFGAAIVGVAWALAMVAELPS